MNDADALAQMFPLRAVPPSGLKREEQRAQLEYLAASNGLWRSIRTPWLYSLTPLAVAEGLITPFGSLQEHHNLLVPMPPRNCWKAFHSLAKSVLPNEAAGWFCWNTASRSWRFAPRKVLSASGAHIDYEEPDFMEDEVPVVDIHSHGRHAAFFSDQDDRDDRSSLKLCVVLGNIDQPTCSIAGRAVLRDNIRPLVFPTGDQWAIDTTK